MFSLNLRNAVARFRGGGRSGHARSFSSIPRKAPKGLRGIIIDLIGDHHSRPSLTPWILVGYAGYCGAVTLNAVKRLVNRDDLELAKIHAMMNQEELDLVKKYKSMMNKYRERNR